MYKLQVRIRFVLVLNKSRLKKCSLQKLTKQQYLFGCFGVRFVPLFLRKDEISKMAKSQKCRTNLAMILLFVAGGRGGGGGAGHS